MTASSGELIGLLGPSGSGKTTLLKLLAGRLQAQSGSVLIGGTPPHQASSIGSIVTYLDTNDVLHKDLTLFENLRLVSSMRNPHHPASAIDIAIYKTLEQVGLSGLEARRWGNLSAGENRRANLSLELLSKPAFFLLDEPTANLDPLNSVEILRIARRFSNEGRVVIIATHNSEHLDYFDKLFFLSGGRLYLESTPRDLMHQLDAETPTAAFFKFYRNLPASPASGAPQCKAEPPRFAQQKHKPTGAEAVATENHASREEHPGDVGGSTAWEGAVLFRQLLPNPFLPCFSQASTLCRRSALSFLRSGAWLPWLLLPVLGALLISTTADPWTLILRSGDHVVNNAAKAKNTIFQIVMVVMAMSILSSTWEIAGDRAFLARERLHGLGLASFGCAKLAWSYLKAILQVLLFLAIFGFRVDLPETGLFFSSGTGDVLLALVLLASTNVQLGLLVSAASANVRQAAGFAVVVLSFEILLVGVLELPRTIAWLSELLPGRWAYLALGSAINVNAFAGLEKPPHFEYSHQTFLGHGAEMLKLAIFYLMATFMILGRRLALQDPIHLRFSWPYGSSEPQPVQLTAAGRDWRPRRPRFKGAVIRIPRR